jgi:hypothetical protein
MIEVGNGFSILALKSALARFGLNHPILGAQITRAYPGAQRLSLTIKPEGPTHEDYLRLISEAVDTLPMVEDTTSLQAEVKELRRQLAEAKGLPVLPSGEPEQV